MLLKKQPATRPAAQETLAHELGRYLEKTLGQNVPWEDWGGEKALPFHLANAFSYKKTRLFKRDVLAVFDRGADWGASALDKQLRLVAGAAQCPVLFVSGAIGPAERAALVKRHIAFAAPGTQLFLPPLGLDLRERFRPAMPETGRLTASAQALLIWALRQPGVIEMRPGDVAKALEYKPMTMTRAFNELEANELASSARDGKQRRLRLLYQGRELWEKAKPLMAGPVTRRIWVPENIEVPKAAKVAGLSALARLGDMNEPNIPVVAVPPTGWGWGGMVVTRRDVSTRPREGTREIQFWAYPPAHFSDGPLVDKFSLLLSLKDGGDERVEMALDRLEESLW